MRKRPPKRVQQPAPTFLPTPAELGFGRLFDGLADAVVVVDREGRIVLWNPAAERLFGYEAATIIGAPGDRLLPDRYRASSRVALAHWHRHGALGPLLGQFPLEAAMCAADGTEIEVEMTLSEIDGPHRDEVWLVAIVRDLRERLRREREAEGRVVVVNERVEQLQELARRLGDAEELAGLGSWSWRIAEDHVEWSPALHRIYGTSPETFGHTYDAFLALVHPADVARAEAIVERAFQEHGDFGFEARIVRPDGEERVIRAAGRVFLDGRGLPVRMGGFCQDITDLQAAIASIARRDAELAQARALDRLKTDLLNAISHELRTPLTAVIAYAEFLEDELAGPLNEGQRAFLRGLQAGAARLRGQIDDLLDFACLEAGAFKLELGDATLGEVLRNLGEDLAEAARMAGLAYDVVEDAPAPEVRLDCKRIGRVLGNLVRNAIKFTPAGGRIEVRIRREGDAVVAVVRDSGPGIAPGDQGLLFKRFSQLSAGRSLGGTGIGLALCRAIAEAHAGSVGVDSQEGAGAAFWLRLPLAGPPPV